MGNLKAFRYLTSKFHAFSKGLGRAKNQLHTQLFMMIKKNIEGNPAQKWLRST